MMNETVRPHPFRKWRKDHGLTLEEVSDLTGYSVAMLSRVERGERNMKPLRRVEVARSLGVSVRDLFPRPTQEQCLEARIELCDRQIEAIDEILEWRPRWLRRWLKARRSK